MDERDWLAERFEARQREVVEAFFAAAREGDPARLPRLDLAVLDG